MSINYQFMCVLVPKRAPQTSTSAQVFFKFYGSDTLWDGRGCPAGDDCYSTLGAPWFYCHFTESEKGAVEVRICCDEIYSNEATLMEQVAM